jgi:DNA-directed RNA polymerase specialized sigma24 family protein
MSGNRLSQIATTWTVLRQAHQGPASDAQAAVQLLVQRYRGAVFHYLRRLLGDDHAAEDLSQEFSMALLGGGLKGADPARGRFRDYVKGVLFHLVSKHRQKAARLPAALAGDHPLWQDLAGQGDPAGEAVGAFVESWREQLLTRAMAELREANATLHAVLTLRTQHPDVPAEQLGKDLAGPLGRELTGEATRQALRRARVKYAELLFDVVAQSLLTDDPAEVDAELADLGLLDYCHPLLDRD